ncbi:hypothetical protein PoB_006660900 [Plakobranchus ocellatus]|uniref:Uncharacterized protein n=1 Tax=Plakobranchus ocellatus TaxID=259542 RepID=A0AAV4D7B9_9GAST|nr:hypothetical protein PoB_006660900 [Plakobranchus ocellatus]
MRRYDQRLGETVCGGWLWGDTIKDLGRLCVEVGYEEMRSKTWGDCVEVGYGEIRSETWEDYVWRYAQRFHFNTQVRRPQIDYSLLSQFRADFYSYQQKALTVNRISSNSPLHTTTQRYPSSR